MFLSAYRYGIEFSDVFRSVSDTTNSAVAAGSIISEGRSGRGGGTTCVMHTQELCLKHALGVCVRKRSGVVVDSFEEGKSLRDRVKLFASKVMDKKAKGRFAEYNRVCLDSYRTPALKIALPNDTRVSGTFLLFSDILRARGLILLYEGKTVYSQVYKDCVLKTDEWKLIAEFEAVMRCTNLLALSSQTEIVGEIAFAWLEVINCKARLGPKRSFNVIDITQTWEPTRSRDEIPCAKVERAQLHPTTRTFIQRLLIEFENYFPHPDGDQLLATNLHPIMHFSGLM